MSDVYYGGTLSPAIIQASATGNSGGFMSSLGSVSGTGLISSLLGGLFSYINTKNTNEANASLAKENNQFNALEAQKARDWNEYFYNQYQSPMAQVRQYEEAGLNPALLYGSAPSPSGNPGSAQASAASMPAQMPADFSPLVSLATSLAQIDNIKANTAKTESETNLHNIELKYKEDELQKGIQVLTNQIDKYQYDIKYLSEQINKTRKESEFITSQTLSEVIKRTGYRLENDLKRGQIESLNYDNIVKYFDAIFYKQYGFHPGSNVNNAFLGILGKAIMDPLNREGRLLIANSPTQRKIDY